MLQVPPPPQCCLEHYANMHALAALRSTAGRRSVACPPSLHLPTIMADATAARPQSIPSCPQPRDAVLQSCLVAVSGGTASPGPQHARDMAGLL